MHYQLDLRAYRCPLPLMMTQKALKGLDQDDELCLWLDKSVSVNDFQLLAKKADFTLKVEEAAEWFRLDWIKN